MYFEDLGLGFGGKGQKIVRNSGFLTGKEIVRFGDEMKGITQILGGCSCAVNGNP